MKKFILVLMTAATLHTSTSQAFLAFGIADERNLYWRIAPFAAAAAVIVCVVFLPVCILDENLDKAAALSQDDLLANGYNQTESQVLVDGAKNLSAALQQNQLQLTVSANDSKVSLRKDILRVYPQASEQFLDLYTDLIVAQ